MRTRIFKLKRQRFLENAGGGTVFFTSEGGDRRHPAKFWRPEDVPEFEGDQACFESEWVRLRGWRIVRRVHKNGQPYEIQPRAEETRLTTVRREPDHDSRPGAASRLV